MISNMLVVSVLFCVHRTCGDTRSYVHELTTEQLLVSKSSTPGAWICLLQYKDILCRDDLWGVIFAELPRHSGGMIMVTQHIPTMTKSHHGGEMSVMIKVGKCQWQNPTIHEKYYWEYQSIPYNNGRHPNVQFSNWCPWGQICSLFYNSTPSRTLPTPLVK